MRFKYLLIISYFITLGLNCFGQNYYSKLFFNDSIAQSSKEILIIDEMKFVLSGRRCLPDFRKCSSLMRLDIDGNVKWDLLLPELNVAE
jgi:hypothetical protein